MTTNVLLNLFVKVHKVLRSIPPKVPEGGNEVEGPEPLGFSILDEETVASQITEYVRRIPMSARTLGVRVENGEPHPGDAARLAKERLF